MKMAWKELMYGKKKYLLIELLIVLLMFMVLFLSGLAEGLGRAVISGIDNMDADYFLLSDSAEDLITVSGLDTEVYDQLMAQTDAELATLDIQRMYLSRQGDEEKLNITYFAIEAGNFLEPVVTEGVQFAGSDAENPILLDDDFALDGIEIGDTVLDSSTELEFTVIGFVEDQMYGHTSIGFITTETYTKLRTLLNPAYEKEYHAIALKGGHVADIALEGTELVAKADIIENVPSYKAEHMTISMIVWVLVVVSATIIGVFYYILTLQKRRQFGIMKAIGLGMRRLAGIAASQVCIIAVCGAAIANLLTFAMAAALPETMPFYLKGGSACLVTVAFILISIVSSLISILNISHVDPMKVIGGADE
ncbi:MAG: ABC transporter permease [Eubacterium sp.]|nr:ABC transporter permease [Eubacterium sp.]